MDQSESFMDDRLKIELAAIDRAKDFDDMKDVQREHAISDAQLRKQLRELITMLRPVSQAFDTAGRVRKFSMATLMYISVAAGALWAILQTYYSFKH